MDMKQVKMKLEEIKNLVSGLEGMLGGEMNVEMEESEESEEMEMPEQDMSREMKKKLLLAKMKNEA